jgi:hypothetical protein
MIIERIGIEGTRLSSTKLVPKNHTDVALLLSWQWTSIPKVAGSFPTVVMLAFQPARCGYNSE